MKFFIIIMWVLSINLIAFTANCIVFPSENIATLNPWKFSIITGNGKLILYDNNLQNPSETYYYKGKGVKGSFEYGNNKADYIQINLGKIKDNILSFDRYYTNGDSDTGTCQIRN